MINGKLKFIFLFACLLHIGLSQESLAAPQFIKSKKVERQVFSTDNTLINADILTYVPEDNLVIATGNVEITQEGRLLLADKLTYNKVTTVVEAIGNVSLLEPDGTVLFSDKVNLRNDLKTGVINNFRARFNDNSLLAANSAERIDESITKLKRTVYSPCKVCEDYAGNTPLWQISAKEVTVDNEDEKVSYNHAFFELLGTPVLYTPYLSHATPGASKKSGFLIPNYSNVSTLGTIVKTPYFYNISSDMDATITPIYTSLEGLVLETEFRHMLKSGTYSLTGSITNPESRDGLGNKNGGNDIRGHLEGTGSFSLGNDWSWGFDGKRSSDDTYLKRYKFGDDDLLTSSVHVQQIQGDNYFGAEAITFQGLNAEDDPDTSPLILPMITSHLQTVPGWNGSWWELDTNLLSLSRTDGVDSSRISSKAAWQLPHTTKSGQVYEFIASVRGDAYEVNDVPDPSNSAVTQEGFVGRLIPEVELDWSWPIARVGNETNIIIEPVVQLILSPHGNNPDKIANEDSQEIEISDMNLFSSNHFTGLDLVEGGPRTNYGLRGNLEVYDLADVNLLFGQSYRTKKMATFTPESGLDKNFSDYVGRVGLDLLENALNLNYRFRLDSENLTSRRSEIDSTAKAGPASLNVTYLLLNEGSAENPLLNREEVTASGSLQLSEFWSISGNTRRDLSEDGGFVNAGTGLHYANECLIFSLLFNRDFTSDRDIKPSESITLQLFLKNLN